MSISTILLASGSPRRRTLLEDAGFSVTVEVPVIDDASVHVHERVPERLVVSLAWFKASQIDFDARAETVMIAADTVCDVEGTVLGKPADRLHAKAMLEGMMNREHHTRTGVCVRSCEGRMLFEDSTLVRIGVIPPHDLEAYLDSEEWRGKAGGYNLADRIAAGWPISIEGDPTTVMGLPMARVAPILRELVARRG